MNIIGTYEARGGMNFADKMGMNKSLTDIPMKSAEINGLRHENVAKAVDETAKVNKDLGDDEVKGPVSAYSGAKNFRMSILNQFVNSSV